MVHLLYWVKVFPVRNLFMRSWHHVVVRNSYRSLQLRGNTSLDWDQVLVLLQARLREDAAQWRRGLIPLASSGRAKREKKPRRCSRTERGRIRAVSILSCVRWEVEGMDVASHNRTASSRWSRAKKRRSKSNRLYVGVLKDGRLSYWR